MKLLVCVSDNVENHKTYDCSKEAPYGCETANIEQCGDNERDSHDDPEKIDSLHTGNEKGRYGRGEIEDDGYQTPRIRCSVLIDNMVADDLRVSRKGYQPVRIVQPNSHAQHE